MNTVLSPLRLDVCCRSKCIMFDAIVVILAIVGVFFMVNTAVGTTKKAKKVIHRKRIGAIKVTPSMTWADKVYMRAGYSTYSMVTYHTNEGDREYLVVHTDGHMVPVYEVVIHENNEFDLVLVQGEYVNV